MHENNVDCNAKYTKYYNFFEYFSFNRLVAMGGHHHQVQTVPDWKIYKVEDAPELMEVKQSLQRQGLKDPWLR